MVDRAGRMVTTNTKARPARPRVLCIFNMATAMAARESILTEADIPGASLRGRKPSELKNEELKVWLRCRDDQVKGLKTKAELVRRGEIGLFTVCGNNLVYKCDVKLTSTFLESRLALNLYGTRILWIQILINYTQEENRRKA